MTWHNKKEIAHSSPTYLTYKDFKASVTLRSHKCTIQYHVFFILAYSPTQKMLNSAIKLSFHCFKTKT